MSPSKEKRFDTYRSWTNPGINSLNIIFVEKHNKFIGVYYSDKVITIIITLRLYKIGEFGIIYKFFIFMRPTFTCMGSVHANIFLLVFLFKVAIQKVLADIYVTFIWNSIFASNSSSI